MEHFVLYIKKIDHVRVKLSRQPQTNKFKILCAHSEPEPRCSIFKVFTLYVMCSKFNISAEFFFLMFWIELVELHKKKYVSNLKNIFYESQNFGSILLIFENNGILNLFRKIFFKFETYLCNSTSSIQNRISRFRVAMGT